jgi:hypothetical protein
MHEVDWCVKDEWEANREGRKVNRVDLNLLNREGRKANINNFKEVNIVGKKTNGKTIKSTNATVTDARDKSYTKQREVIPRQKVTEMPERMPERMPGHGRDQREESRQKEQMALPGPRRMTKGTDAKDYPVHDGVPAFQCPVSPKMVLDHAVIYLLLY